jgi:hypothetical protein
MKKIVPIGWPRTPLHARIRQGAKGGLLVTLTVVADDGAPLSSYDGFTAALAFCRGLNRAPTLSLEPTVEAVPASQQLAINIDFATENTIDLGEGELRGDLCLIAPDGSRQYPLDVTLTVERRFTP